MGWVPQPYIARIRCFPQATGSTMDSSGKGDSLEFTTEMSYTLDPGLVQATLTARPNL
jgi:hypothetical protein